MKHLNLPLALAAGLIGGALSHYAWPQPVQAQSQTPKEIRAQSFVLEDAAGKTLGTLSVETRAGNYAPGQPRALGTIRLLDDHGHEVWRTPAGLVHPATN